ncbi:MAG: ribonuclease III [Bacilli bacterium]|nr:ribonuclease III [Bacilli bacterium]
MKTNLDSFFKKVNITPKDEELYKMAFTHSSFNGDKNTKHKDYERLEFIGDAVLGFVTASLIYKHHPEMKEGEMTKTRSALVQSSALAKYALNLGYDEYIRSGHSLTHDEAARSQKILEDIFEAVLGAIYLDQGIEVATKFITSIFEEDIINYKVSDSKDYKSLLQEAMQAEYRESVTYRVIKEFGPPHNKTFESEVMFNGIILGRGSGKSKKESEQEAAKAALMKKAL